MMHSTAAMSFSIWHSDPSMAYRLKGHCMARKVTAWPHIGCTQVYLEVKHAIILMVILHMCIGYWICNHEFMFRSDSDVYDENFHLFLLFSLAVGLLIARLVQPAIAGFIQTCLDVTLKHFLSKKFAVFSMSDTTSLRVPTTVGCSIHKRIWIPLALRGQFIGYNALNWSFQGLTLPVG